MNLHTVLQTICLRERAIAQLFIIYWSLHINTESDPTPRFSGVMNVFNEQHNGNTCGFVSKGPLTV